MAFALRRAVGMAVTRRATVAAVPQWTAVTRQAPVRTFALFNDPDAVRHKSDAEELIAGVPVIEVDGTVAVCDGGGGATGHPVEWIQLDRRGGRSVEVCKYCGLQYIMSERAAAALH